MPGEVSVFPFIMLILCEPEEDVVFTVHVGSSWSRRLRESSAESLSKGARDQDDVLESEVTRRRLMEPALVTTVVVELGVRRIWAFALPD